VSEKFEPVEVNPKPCAEADREAHLRAFINSFIIKPRRGRCIHIFIESPQKAAREFHQIERVDSMVARGRLVVTCIVTMDERRFRNLRIFVGNRKPRESDAHPEWLILPGRTSGCANGPIEGL
jgi:hypothetical protein